MRGEDCECWHGIHRKSLRERGRQGLSKERDSTLGLGARWEKTTLETLVGLGNKERGSTKAATTVWGVNLMVEKLLYVIDGQQVLAIHRDNDRIPDLRNKDLQVGLYQ